MTAEILSSLREINFENEWYEAADARHFWMEWRFRELQRLIDECRLDRRAPLRVLEAGGGHGVARTQVEAATAWTVDLTDLNMTSLDRCGPSRGRSLYYDIHDRTPSLRAAYDVVLLLDVLEHIERPRQFLESLAWHLRPGGTLIINVPALPWFFSAYDTVLGHYRRYTRASLAAELAAAGFSCDRVKYWGLAMLPLLAARSLVMRRLPADARERSRLARRGMMPPSAGAAWLLRTLMRAELSLSRDAVLGTSLLCAAHPGLR